jgi:hypothetical protein
MTGNPARGLAGYLAVNLNGECNDGFFDLFGYRIAP